MSQTPLPSPPGKVAATKRFQIIRVIAIAVFICGITATTILRNYDWLANPDIASSSFELPLGGVRGIAVDSQNRIYVASAEYQRIQVYSPDGVFIIAYLMGRNAGGASFGFRITQGDALEVYGFGGGNFCVFKDGKLLERHTGVKLPPFDTELNWQAPGPSGTTFAIAPASWCVARVVRIAEDGNRKVIWLQPWYLWIVKAPFPAFTLAFLSLFLFWFADGFRQFRSRNRRNRNSPYRVTSK